MATASTLTVQPTGTRSWIQRIVIRGRRRDVGLGGFPLVSLKEARDKAFANRKAAREWRRPGRGQAASRHRAHLRRRG